MKNTYLIGEFSEMTGIPVRTLHYYDEIGLLKPNKLPSGHRSYDHDDLVTLQKIVSLKLLSLSLEQIRSLLEHPSYDVSLVNMLKLHQQALELKREQLDISLEAVGRMIMVLQNEGQLEHHTLFSLIRNMQQQKDQREWVARHLSEQVASNLFDVSPEGKTELDRQFVQFVKEVKRLTSSPFDSPEAESVIGHYVSLVSMHLGKENLEHSLLMEQEQLTQLEKMVHIPFSVEEITWLDLALAHYVDKFGIQGGES